MHHNPSTQIWEITATSPRVYVLVLHEWRLELWIVGVNVIGWIELVIIILLVSIAVIVVMHVKVRGTFSIVVLNVVHFHLFLISTFLLLLVLLLVLRLCTVLLFLDVVIRT